MFQHILSECFLRNLLVFMLLLAVFQQEAVSSRFTLTDDDGIYYPLLHNHNHNLKLSF